MIILALLIFIVVFFTFYQFMAHRNTLLRPQKSVQKECFTNESRVSYSLDGLQDISTLSRLTFSKEFRKTTRKSSSLFSCKHKKRIRTEPNYSDALPQLKKQNNFKLNYHKSSLAANFSEYISDEYPGAADRVEWPKAEERTQDWIIKKKAYNLKLKIYEEESKRVAEQLKYISQIKNRLKIVEDIKKQKRNLILKYFN